MDNFEEQFGKEATDIITGFTGIVSAYSKYITGCGTFLLNTKVGADGKKNDGHWFDEGRLKFSKNKVVEMNEFNDDGTGCDIPAPVR